MMCLACEQDSLWLAYLQRRGLITPDGYLVEPPPFLADAGETQEAQAELPFPADAAEAGPGQADNKDDSASKPAGDGKFSCDDPQAGAADLKFLQSGRKSD
jgi:hypothetical protein